MKKLFIGLGIIGLLFTTGCFEESTNYPTSNTESTTFYNTDTTSGTNTIPITPSEPTSVEPVAPDQPTSVVPVVPNQSTYTAPITPSELNSNKARLSTQDFREYKENAEKEINESRNDWLNEKACNINGDGGKYNKATGECY